MYDVNKPNRARQWFALGLMCLGWTVGRGAPPEWDVITMVYVLHFFSIVMFWFFESDFIMWKRKYYNYIYGDDAPKVEAEVKSEPRKLIDLSYKDNKWQNDTVTVKFDMERQFAKGLLIMRDYAIAQNLPIKKVVKLTEAKWVKPNKFRNREELIAVIDKWGESVVARESAAKNATYVVRDWDAVERVADGEKVQ